ncbi:bifunctional heptose 7-phosphate kinase/heptose 1-phosphate adenyltransferase [Mitsuokella multacida]|uniref:bifunctional heptose 7-phosphate kinase/heptose 1-phosphate adenyltransferase n=1 Tax=Mitsuokella multacida TaxID=52226 RepID=UPI0022E28488|nr:PfkB family carbohydrate kinase [Mitsuokella multacida]
MNALQQEYHDALSGMQGRSILVIGDMVADIYLDGRISRISREAPVLVLEQAGEKVVAGGAANVVNNIATLGGKVHAVGLVGRDKSADGLRAILAKNGADVRGLIADASRPTISKTRIIAGGRATVSQQIVRIDRESKAPMAPTIEAELSAYIKSILPTVEGVVISDYGSGTVTEGLQALLIDYCRAHDIPSIVDSRYAVRRFRGIGYVKQNDAEIAAAMGRELVTTEDIVAAAEELRQELAAKGVLVTRGELGMVLVEHGAVHEIPVSDKSEVFDVSGAGDTCVAAVILALAAGIAPATAARLSNIASGIAVRKLGTSTVSVRELAEAIEKSREEYTSK